jgi:hypothetical protein
MTFDLQTLVAIRIRMKLVRGQPLLFHDVWTPQRRRARVDRIMRWLGPIGVAITDGYLHGTALRRDVPLTGRRFGKGAR